MHFHIEQPHSNRTNHRLATDSPSTKIRHFDSGNLIHTIQSALEELTYNQFNKTKYFHKKVMSHTRTNY